MKLLILLFLIPNLHAWRIFHRGTNLHGSFGLPCDPNDVSCTWKFSVQVDWFTQNLDHFNPSDIRTWKQRFYINDQYFNSSHGGPVFLMVYGEGTASPIWANHGAWIEYAKKFGALCFLLEHRYYGESRPTEDMSTENLQYLTTQQALADSANFISAINDRYGLYTKWIVFGGSYAGSLVAWLRLKYPHLVGGAISSSAPLLAQVDYKEYFKVVAESLRTVSKECVETIKEGTEGIDELLHHAAGQKSLTAMFKLCDPVENNPNDIATLYKTLATNFAAVVQNSGREPGLNIDNACNIMTNETLGSPIDRLAAVNSLIISIFKFPCQNNKYNRKIEANRNITWDSGTPGGGRQWIYQTCAEYGFFPTSSHTPQIFGNKFPVELSIQECTDIFGPKYNSTFINAAVNRTNIFFGALNIKVDEVIFVHGSLDPWYPLGILQSENERSPAIVINGASHCADLFPSTDNDLAQLKAAREKIVKHIARWIHV